MSKWIDEQIEEVEAYQAEAESSAEGAEYLAVLKALKKAEAALREVADDEDLIHYSGGYALQSQAREALDAFKELGKHDQKI